MYNSNCQKKFSIISWNHDSTVFHTFLEDFWINSWLLITDDSATFSERLTQYIREFYWDDVCKVYDWSIEERKNLSLELEVSWENLKKLVNILLSNEFIETRKWYNNNLSLGGLLYHQFVKWDMTILFATQESGNQDSNRILSSLIEVEVIWKQPDLVNFTKLEKIIALHDFSANIW
jgi:hypothetical protein